MIYSKNVLRGGWGNTSLLQESYDINFSLKFKIYPSNKILIYNDFLTDLILDFLNNKYFDL